MIYVMDVINKKQVTTYEDNEQVSTIINDVRANGYRFLQIVADNDTVYVNIMPQTNL